MNIDLKEQAHGEIERIFRILLPQNGLAVREEQIALCHTMLDTLLPVSYTHLDVYKRQVQSITQLLGHLVQAGGKDANLVFSPHIALPGHVKGCLLYTSRCV